MGERGADHTIAPTDAEIAEMARQTAEALDAGSLGFSTSRTYVHRSRDGANIGTLTASHAELLGIVSALKDRNKGVIQLISDAYLTPDDTFAEAEIDLIRKMAETSGRRLSFTIMQTDDAPDRWLWIMDKIKGMVASGLDVKGQVAPRPIGVIMSFSSTVNPFFLTPTYRGLLSKPLDERLRILAQPEVKDRILAEHKDHRVGGMTDIILHGFERMHRMTDPIDYEPSADQSIAAEAGKTNRTAADFCYDVLLEGGGTRMLYMPLNNYARGTLRDVHGMMTAPHVLYGLSDGGAHCGTISDGSFPTTTLGLWVKGSKEGLNIPLEQLVNGYTQRTAAHVGWHDRGVIAPGKLADLNVIALDELSLGPPNIVQDLPAGGTRLLQSARGYRWTIKTGAVTFENGVATGELPGRLVRGGRAA
jgi:N-acyl-D-aspartate/D-glutamate deacylase